MYNHPSVQSHFNARAWVCVSQQWQAKDILQGILIKLMPERREEIQKWRDEELGRELRKVQQERRCLFVLDDIWATNVWEDMKHAFSLGSKILLTTRNRDVALHIDPSGFHHQLRFLSADESWELLRKKALRRRYAEGTPSTSYTALLLPVLVFCISIVVTCLYVASAFFLKFFLLLSLSKIKYFLFFLRCPKLNILFLK